MKVATKLRPFEVIPMLGSISVDLISKDGYTASWEPFNTQEPFEYVKCDGNSLLLYQDNQLMVEYVVLSLARLEEVFINLPNYIRKQQEKHVFENISLEYIFKMCALSTILQETNHE